MVLLLPPAGTVADCVNGKDNVEDADSGEWPYRFVKATPWYVNLLSRQDL